MTTSSEIASPSSTRAGGLLASEHLPLYAMEGALLGLFMISACLFTALLEHPASPVHRALPSTLLRRGLIGTAMGVTAVLLIYSSWGRRCGAHMNPAVTLCFLRLGKIGARDAFFYITAQFLGAMAGVLSCALIAGAYIAHPSVNFVATVPGSAGAQFAWVAEFIIALVMMSAVLIANRIPRFGKFTGCIAASLVTLYITVEAPISGMSLNPARTFASALWANAWMSLWIYFTAPVAGMLAAVEIQLALGHQRHALCGKLSHSAAIQCIFRCNCARAHGIAKAAA